MKVIIYLTLGTVFIVLTACGKDDDGEPTYSKSDFIGTWEMQPVKCPDDPGLLIITRSTIQFPSLDEAGCFVEFNESEYTFDGRAFDVTLLGLEGTLEVIEYSEDEFTWRETSGGGSPVTFKRVE